MGGFGPVTTQGKVVVPPTSSMNTLSIQPRIVTAPGQGRGYQFPCQKLPPANGKKSSKTAQTVPKPKPTTTSASKTTAPMFPDEILPNLYISDLETASAIMSPNYAAPGRPKIKYVLSLLESAAHQPKMLELNAEANFVLKLIVISDWSDTNLIEHLPEARNFIKDSLAANDGGVLVHCRKGISRSGSVMVAFVMESLALDYDAALVHVQKTRQKVYPNIGFQNQLKLWKRLDYSLRDLDGAEKREYSDWKRSSKLRTAI